MESTSGCAVQASGAQVTTAFGHASSGSACGGVVNPGGESAEAPSPIEAPRAVSLESAERAAIEAALARHGGNRTHAALELGISRRTIINKIKLYGLAP